MPECVQFDDLSLVLAACAMHAFGLPVAWLQWVAVKSVRIP
jgi:hypothetical protein